ncbi:MAG TPA: RES family NAD+ phosphorylase [Acidobacteriota bacterium]|nr:RES family NAD+ phosphorylase [Acidobacteriota bacterium]
MIAWRIVSKRRQNTAFDGEGARRFGGRWNPPGTRIVYTSSNLSLAALEFFVHVSIQTKPDDLISISLEIPDHLTIERIPESRLPKNWRNYPALPQLQSIGQKWLKAAKNAVLAVPSAIIPQELNYLINPEHADFAKCRINKPQPFVIDSRMFK